MELVNELPYDLRWNVIKFSTHPVADLFKQELEEDLEWHFHVFKEGPCYEPNWCADDEELFAYRSLCMKLHEKGSDLQSWHLYNRGISLRR